MTDWELPAFFVCAAIVLGIFAFTGTACQSEMTRAQAVSMAKCVDAGGSWVGRVDACIVPAAK